MGSGSAAEAQQLHAYLQSRGYVHAARGLLEDMRDAGHTPGPACAAMEESQSAPAVGPAEVKMTTPNDGAGRSARRRPSAGTGDPAVSSAKCAAATPSPNAPSRAGRTAAPERHSGGAALVDVGGGVMCELEEADAAEFEGLQTGQAQGVVFHPHADAAECLSPVASPGALPQREPFETLQLPFISAPMRSSLEETVNYPIEVGGVVVGRYRIVDYLGQGVFSRAVQCIDLQSGQLVCLKITRNNKDFFDMGLMEVKVLRLLNEHDPSDEMHVLRLLSFFYHKEHLFFVCELLRDNLYELYRYVSCSPSMQPYFTLPRVRSIAHQCLVSLAYIHSFGLIHCDLKPENIVIQSFSRCRIKVIDFGSSTFPRDPHSSYVQASLPPRGGEGGGSRGAQARACRPGPAPAHRHTQQIGLSTRRRSHDLPAEQVLPSRRSRRRAASKWIAALRIPRLDLTPPLLRRAVALLPRARGALGIAVRRADRHLVARLYPG